MRTENVGGFHVTIRFIYGQGFNPITAFNNF